MTNLGICSLNDMLRGTIKMRITYDAPAISSLQQLFEPHTHSQIYFKKLINFFSSLKEFSYSGDCENLKEVVDFVILIFKKLGLEFSPVVRTVLT